MSPQYDESAHLLRRALMGNAVFSTLSGLTVLFAQGWVLQILGLSPDVSLVILGIGLIVFAAILVISARRQHLKMSDAWIAVLMDLAWVLGSYLLIFVVPFSTGGKWVVGAVAELVLLFAVLQFVGIRRIQKSEQLGWSWKEKHPTARAGRGVGLRARAFFSQERVKTDSPSGRVGYPRA